MLPILKSKQPVVLEPTDWTKVKMDDIVFCKCKGNYYTHLVKATDLRKGVLIGNNHGHLNGWTKSVYGKVIKILD